MINILIDKSGKTSKENIFLGNQHENLDETLHFLFPQEYKDYYKYITYSYSNNNQRVTGISPLVDDNFIVSSKITKISGIWELNLICKTSPVDLNDKVIDLTENNSSKEHIFISNTINACVSGNSIDVESFNNVAVDENIANLYDSILALKNRVEENDKAHEQNEEIRKANELERQEEENYRKANESERVSAEQLRVEAETERSSAETARTSAETERQNAETNRANAERLRAEAETERKKAEVARGAEENKRTEAETARKSAEINRVNAENERVSSETLRKQAEANRVETENSRVSAESVREHAEQSRISAESQRVTAEATRESAESARVNAEQSRVDTEKLRVAADTDRTNKTNTALKALEDAVESEREKYSQHFFENAFALQRTGKVYTVKFPLWKTSHTPEGEKLDDNAGLVLEPSTKTFRGRNDYKDIPLFKTYDVNAYVDNDGVRHVTAIKGDRNFKDTGKNDVFVLGMSYYEKTWSDDQYWYYSRTDMPKEGYTAARECINRDGTVQPYTLCAKYVSSMIDGVYYSTKGRFPARACLNAKGNVTSVDNSYYGLINNCKKKGKFYSGGLMSEYKSILTSQWLMLGTTAPKTKIWGCSTYSYITPASIKSADKHTYFPVPKSQADNYPIGACVSVGYNHLNDNGTATLDRAYSEIHAYANDVKILRKESLDDNNVAIYLDVKEPFSTMPVQLNDTVSSDIYLTSMHWQSGFSDNVLDRYGCPCEDKSGLTNGKYPMVWQGIELMVGGFEVFSNAFMDIVNLTTRDIYLTNDATKLTTDDATAKTTYKKLPYQMSVTKNNQWNYVTEIKLDLENGAFVQTQSGQDGSSSATGFGDAIYFDGATSGTREFLALGDLGSWSFAGLAYCLGSAWLSSANWSFLARLSVNAVGGELTA